jgi:hypothetical protein
VRLSTPARAAPVCTIPGNPRTICAITFTTRPRLLASIPFNLVPSCSSTEQRAAHDVMFHVPSKLLRTTARNPLLVRNSAKTGNFGSKLVRGDSVHFGTEERHDTTGFAGEVNSPVLQRCCRARQFSQTGAARLHKIWCFERTRDRNPQACIHNKKSRE